MDDSMESGFSKLVAGMLVGTMKALIDGGVSPSSAARLASVGLIVGALGRGALLELGVPLRTVQQWQAEVREGLRDMPDQTPPAAAINQALAAMGFPFQVVER